MSPETERDEEKRALLSLADEWERRAEMGRTGYSPYEGGTHATGLAQAAAELRRAVSPRERF